MRPRRFSGPRETSTTTKPLQRRESIDVQCLPQATTALFPHNDVIAAGGIQKHLTYRKALRTIILKHPVQPMRERETPQTDSTHLPQGKTQRDYVIDTGGAQKHFGNPIQYLAAAPQKLSLSQSIVLVNCLAFQPACRLES